MAGLSESANVENMKTEHLILNVEDFAPARYVKTRLLRNAGFLVEEASCGRQALEMVARLQPVLVLLDVKLPDIDGLEVCRRIKSDSATRSVIVIHTSAAYLSAQDIRNSLESGGERYLPVPFEPQDLIAAIHAVLH